MKTLNLAPTLLAVVCLASAAHATTIHHIPARVALGSDATISGFTGFFSNGFVAGSTSHNNVLSFDDGVVQVDFDITVEAFDEAGSPTALRPTPSAVGIDGAGDTVSEQTRIDTGESIKVTLNDVNFSVIGAPAVGSVDPGSFEALMSTIRLAAFDSGVDTYTYAGVGAAAVTGDDTDTIDFVPDQTLVDGDMFTITADSGEFRGLYISLAGEYCTVVPEPATISLVALSLLGLTAQRRRS